jgi:hypothetical protein
MFKQGEEIPAEVVFAFHMMMVRYNLSAADVLRLLVKVGERST